MKNILHSFMTIFVGLCVSCTMGPDYVRPDAPTETSYTREKNLTQFGSQKIDSNKKISENWWEEFKSPKLNEVVTYGLKHNPHLAAVQKSLEQALDTLDAEKAQLWPQINLKADAGRQKYGASFLGPLDITIPPFTYYEVGPSLTYLIDIFGATRRAIENQQALKEYQEYAYQSAYLSLTGKIVSNSLNIGSLNDQLHAAHALIRDDKKNLQLIEEAFKLGALTQNDVLSAQNQLQKDEAFIPTLQLELVQAKNELNELVGAKPTDWTPPNFQLSDFKLPRELPLTMPSELVRNRPDILAAEAVLHAANAGVGVATANLYPNIVLTGDYLQEALNPANLFLASAAAWNYIGSITAPILNGGLLQAEKRAAVRIYEGSLINYEDVVLKSFIQVNDVLQALKFNEEAEKISLRALATAKASLKLAQTSQSVGGAGSLTVVAADRNYRLSELIYARVHGQRYQDTLQLYLSLGGATPSAKEYPGSGAQ